MKLISAFDMIGIAALVTAIVNAIHTLIIHKKVNGKTKPKPPTP